MANPVSSGIPFKTAMEHIKRATAAMDRVQQLQGQQYRPMFRLTFRPQWVRRIKEEVDRGA